MSDPAITVIALLVAGYLLTAAELFVIPGFGVAGIGGLACLLGGCFLAFHYFGNGYGGLVVVLILSTATALLIWIPKSRFGRDVVHSTSLADSKASGGEPLVAIGARGVAETDLRPAGIARFGEVRQSVVTDGEFINANEPLTVMEIRGSRVVVELASSTDDEPS